MKKQIITFLSLVFLIMAVSGLAHSQPVTGEEAKIVAENWIKVVIQDQGSWGAFEEASIETVQEFTRKSLFVGFFCQVRPKGYIIVSPRREMAPIKAYSARSDLDPESEEGMADLLKSRLKSILERVQNIAREREQVTGHAVADNLEIDYRPVWDALINDPEGFMINSQQPQSNGGGDAALESEPDKTNYQEGQVLLSSNWHQHPPYNNDCPDLGCTSPSNGLALVGCVATAGAQIMYYWGWPPYGEGGSLYSDSYDWPNMRDSVTTSSPSDQQSAVAELSHEVGVAVGMDYGCSCNCSLPGCCSSSYTYDMEGVYENHYRFTNVYRRNRSSYSATSWFELMKAEFNYNRPVQYRIEGHSIVGDGWKEIGDPVVRQYHMNYGWTGTGTDTWYTLDSLTTDPEKEEYLLEEIRPEPCMTSLTGTFTRQSFPYRYFYRDTWGGSGTFEGGQRIQFLPGIVVWCSSGTVTFQGSASYFSHLFTRGDLDRGVRMYKNENVAIKLYDNGGIKFH